MSVPTQEQAAELVEHFGEPRAAAQAVGVSQSTVYRWLLSPDRQAQLRRADRERMRRRRADPNYRNPSRTYIREYMRTYRRKRWASDPEYRARERERMRRYRRSASDSVACVVIRPDGARVLARIERDPLAEQPPGSSAQQT